MNTRVSLALAAVVSTTGCAGVETARLDVPQGLERAAREEVTGPVGGRRGEVSLGPIAARFARTTATETFHDRYEVRSSELTLDFARPGGQVTARCAMHQQDALAGFGLSVDLVPMRYDCRFEGPGLPGGATLALAAHDTGERAVREERRGRLDWQGRTVEIRSLHGVDGVRFPMGTPTGYLLSVDDAPVAALERMGRPALFLGAGTDADTAEAARVAGLALALLNDPDEF